MSLFISNVYKLNNKGLHLCIWSEIKIKDISIMSCSISILELFFYLVIVNL